MTLTLNKIPKDATIIQGYPGFGLVGTIATEYLLEHLKCQQIGRILLEDQPALIAIHDGKVVEPIGLFYNKKHNLLIVHAINSTAGLEWEIANILLEVARKISAKEIICIEGVGSPERSPEGEHDYRTFYFTNQKENEKRFKKIKLAPLKEGIIMGVTSALLLVGEDDFNISCMFAETRTHLPDSKAAANAIQATSDYLDLGIDIQPLLDSAEKFEEKLHNLLEQSKMARTPKKSKQDLSYLG